MAYITYYNVLFSNELNEEIVFEIQRKDGDPNVVVETLTATEYKRNSEADGDGVYSTIIRNNIELVLNLTAADSVTWETFFDNVHDEWRVVSTDDAQHIFAGFMLPDEGTVPFEDKPYDLVIRATDCLGLLKNVSLKNNDDTNFHGAYTLIEYIAACLYRTGLQLPIKISCDIFESSMDDRGVAIANDMFNQAKLDHRTFMKTATEFVSCFEALEIIFGEHFRIFQDYDLTTNQQVWCINRIPEYQYVPAPIVYYTLYSYDGISPVGYEDPENYAEVGKLNMIYKTNEVTRSGKFAVKSVRTIFKYTVWPELPLNSKFERGDLVLLLSGPNYTSWEIDDWEFGQTSGAILTSSFDYPFALDATTKRAYRKSTYSIYGVELSREVIIERPTTSGRANWLRSEGVPVNSGDKINLSFDVKYESGISGFSGGSFSRPVWVYIVSDDGLSVYGLLTALDNSIEPKWEQSFISSGSTPLGSVELHYTGNDPREFNSVSLDPPVIPANGSLYVALSVESSPSGTHATFRNFNLDYFPYVANGYIEVKGDYWEHSQTANYIDIVETEIKISDSHTRAIKGNLLRSDGITATTPTWYRYGRSESLHYKQIANLGRYNIGYRRFFKVEGTFTGTKYSPQNDPTNVQPISFRKTYKLLDLPEQPECVLVAPLSIDYRTGWITAIFEEVRRTSADPITESYTDLLTRIVAAINSTTEAEWDSAGLAPASGTPAFPPYAAIWNTPNSISVAMNEAHNMSVTYTIGSAGNSPYITETYNAATGFGQRVIIYEIGTDIAIGNTFIFTAYDHDVAVTVQATTNGSNDGRQTGDSSTFNYLFE